MRGATTWREGPTDTALRMFVIFGVQANHTRGAVGRGDTVVGAVVGDPFGGDPRAEDDYNYAVAA
jgi:hypothetical protein